MMKTILLLAVLIPLQVFAGLPPTTLKGQGGSNVTTFGFQVPLNQATQVSGVNSLIETGNTNILANPGFEGTTGWTASGGATTAINSTAAGTGSQGYDWDSNGASQTLTGDAVTIPAGLKGKNGVASCAIKTVSGTATHTIQAYDGTNIVATGTIGSSTSVFQRTSINFVFPTSGTLTVRIVSVASNEPEIYVDDCYLGVAEGFNVGTIAQFGDWTSYTPTFTSFGTVSTQSFRYRTAPEGIEIEGRFTTGTVTATESRISLPSICTSASNYTTLEQVGTVAQAVNAATYFGNNALIEPSVTYLTFGDLSSTTNALTKTTGTVGFTNATAVTVKAYVRCAGFSSNAIYKPDVGASYWSGYHGSGCAAWTRTNTSYGAITDDAAGCTLTDLQKSGITAATTGSVSPAIAVTLPRTGTYKVCAYPVAGGSGSAVHQYRLWDGTTTIAEGSLDIASDATIPLCGFYSATSLTPTFTVQCKASSGTCTINAGASDVGILWTINPVTGNVPAPVLVGSVTSNATGAERIERAELNCDASSSITSQSGSWLSAIGNRSTAACSITIAAGIFTSTPTCVFTVKAATVQATSVNMTSATAGTVYGASADYDGYLMCMGPR